MRRHKTVFIMSPSTVASSTSHQHHGNHHHGNDVRKYITIKPIPVWEGAVESKLVARNLKYYTLDYPTREQVFRENYARRKQQMDTQGYYSVPWRPYREVGFPIYLNTKQLVQTSLGQTDSDNEKGNAGNGGDGKENSEVETKSSRKSKNKKMSTATFVMKHKEQSDLQDIERDRRSVQATMANVKMGHALFPMLEEERNRSDAAFLVDKQNQLRQSHHEVRIHPVDTQELEVKDAIDLKVKKRMSLKSQGSRASLLSSASHASPRMVAKKAEVERSVAEQVRPFTPVHSNISYKIEDGGEGVCSRVWKQLCALHWIYVASTLNSTKDHKRQMTPLCECWSEADPGGRAVDARSHRQEQRTNENWRRFKDASKKPLRTRGHRKGFHMGAPMKRNSSFASNLSGYQGYQGGYQGPHPMKRNSSIASNLSGYDGPRSNRPPSASSGILRLLQHQNSVDFGASLDSSEGLPPRPTSPGQSSVTTTIMGGTVAGSDFGDDDVNTEAGFSTTEVDRDDHKLLQRHDDHKQLQRHGDHKLLQKHDDHKQLQKHDDHKQLQKLLSTVASSVRNEMQSREKAAERIAQQNNILPLSVFDWSRSNYCTVRNKEVSLSQHMATSATDVTDFQEPATSERPAVKVRPHTAAVHNRRGSTFQQLRPSTSVTPGSKVNRRPQSSPAKLSSFQFRFSSEDKVKNLGQIREDFEGVNDTKALQLHNLLTSLEKRRKQRMEKKFGTFRVSSSMHRDLEGMRVEARSEMLQEQNSRKKRTGVLPCDWLNILNSNLPPFIHDDVNCDIILQKLGNLVISNPHPITPDSFLGALGGLKLWELCAPDVSAAIEFIREKVVGMPADQFDEWRKEAMTQRKVITGADSFTTQQKLTVKT